MTQVGPFDLSDRKILAFRLALPNSEAVLRTTANGEELHDDLSWSTVFESGQDPCQFSVVFREPISADGVSLRLRLSGWKDVIYVAVGYTRRDNTFAHVKIHNPLHEEEFEIEFSDQDFSYQLNNGWIGAEPHLISDARVYVRGDMTSATASVHVSAVAMWASQPRCVPLSGGGEMQFDDLLQCSPPTQEAMSPLYRYWIDWFPDYERQANRFLQEGVVPLHQNRATEWLPLEAKPANFENNTDRFAWFALAPVAILILAYRQDNDKNKLLAARDLVNNWVSFGLINQDPDSKYNWYDHGVADRLMTLLLIWEVALSENWDRRFVARLGELLISHTRLLASESFYVSDQPYRYHNHALFQDLAVFAACRVLGWWSGAEKYREAICPRFLNQIEHLVIEEGEYGVSIENSIDYHVTLEQLLYHATEFGLPPKVAAKLSAVRTSLSRFTDIYVDHREQVTPVGDSFRSPNPLTPIKVSALQDSAFLVLEKPGYGIVKGNHAQIPFDLRLFATSLCETHKHQDLLSMTLTFAGIDWLIDPSYFSHVYREETTQFLRSYLAHNCVAIEGMEYDKYTDNVRIVGTEDNGTFKLNGHHGAFEGCIVEREIQGHLDRLEIHVIDSLQQQVPHCSLTLHIGDGVTCNWDGSGYLLNHPATPHSLMLELPNEGEVIQGWQPGSDRHGISGTSMGNTIDTTLITVPFETKIEWCIKVQV